MLGGVSWFHLTSSLVAIRLWASSKTDCEYLIDPTMARNSQANQPANQPNHYKIYVLLKYYVESTEQM